jgi:uncharacterized protein (TIGR02145 family)
MNKFFITLSFCLVTLTFFAQSKKEMIELLNKRVDSLNQIVRTERSDKEQLNQQLEKLRFQIDELNKQNNKLSSDLENLDKQKTNLIATASEKEIAYEKTLKLKQDSLALLATELLKYSPAPVKEEPKLIVKQDNSGPIKSVTIGSQVWMVENLNVSTFRNGVSIPEAKSDEEWNKARENKQPAWCYYDNDPKNGVKYGKLYNWYAVVDTNGICPQGWHVPSYKEWETLVSYLGENPGTKMKAKSGWNKVESGGSATCPVCSGWNDEYRRKTACHRCKDTRRIPAAVVYHSGDGNNLSGFTGLPGGYRGYLGNYYRFIGNLGYWWSSPESKAGSAWVLNLYGSSGSAGRSLGFEKDGFSVRCLRD